MCSVPFVVVVVAAAAVFLMCVYSCHYEYNSYTLVVCLGKSQLCDNDNHDMPQNLIRTVKWRDNVDGN
jgi:hypothetical protein